MLPSQDLNALDKQRAQPCDTLTPIRDTFDTTSHPPQLDTDPPSFAILTTRCATQPEADKRTSTENKKRPKTRKKRAAFFTKAPPNVDALNRALIER